MGNEEWKKKKERMLNGKRVARKNGKGKESGKEEWKKKKRRTIKGKRGARKRDELAIEKGNNLNNLKIIINLLLNAIY